MSFDIIKEQRMIRTLYYSLITAAEIIKDDKAKAEEFVNKVSKFIQERTIIDEGTREIKEVIRDHVATLGWKNIKCNFKEDLGTGEVTLGKNRYIINEIADSDATLLTIRGIFEGICYHMIKHPVKAEVSLSLRADSFYDIKFSRRRDIAKDDSSDTKTSSTLVITDRSIHSSLKNEHLFDPIFKKDVPDVILFDAAWKVITESFVANYTAESDELIKEALKVPSLENLSLIIMKLTEEHEENEILNMAEIIGEFFTKLLGTKMGKNPFDLLQSTLQDKHAESYLIYYECRTFCANKNFTARCQFVRGFWIGILNEIYGFQMKIKDLMHAGKRDRYCMLELVRDEEFD